MKSKITCHLCGNPFNVIKADRMPNQTGIYVQCGHPECPTNEAVFGFGKTEEDAAEIAAQKYRKR